jgi:hypothetical protein
MALGNAPMLGAALPSALPMIAPAAAAAGMGATAAPAAAAAMGFMIPSSRDYKHDNTPIDDADMLDAVREMPVERWRYREGGPGADGEQAHIGPYAEDWQRLTGTGDGKTINFVDALGVAFATIKALDAEVRELRVKLEMAQW